MKKKETVFLWPCMGTCTFRGRGGKGEMGGAEMKEKQEDGRFCRAYLRTMDPERAAAEIGRRDGYAMLEKRATQQKLERMRCAAAAGAAGLRTGG